MKRRVIQIANSTQLISLPRKWSLQFNIKKGDELEVEENGSKLSISTEKEIFSDRVEVNFIENRPLTDSMIYRYLSAIYKAGCDEIYVTYQTPQECEIAQRTVNNEFVGFEIVEEGKNYFMTKKISNLEVSEFDTMLKRTFFFLNTMAKDGLEAVRSNDRETLKNLVIRDININKLTDYTRRIINKNSHTKYKRTHPLYLIIEHQEKIGDGYKKIFRMLGENNIKLDKRTINIYSRVTGFLESFYNLFYDFKLEKVGKFIADKRQIEAEIMALLGKVDKKDTQVLIYLYYILYLIFDCNGPIMAIKV